jgi:hypothetical protein
MPTLLNCAPVPENDDRRFPADYTIAELSAIATRALVEGDDYSRGLLKEQLLAEEFRGYSR